jgi:hypothetical protein
MASANPACEQTRGQHRSGRANWMTVCDGAAFDDGKSELPGHRNRDRGECFLPACAFEGLVHRRYRTESEYINC